LRCLSPRIHVEKEITYLKKKKVKKKKRKIFPTYFSEKYPPLFRYRKIVAKAIFNWYTITMDYINAEKELDIE
jgi:hypothetical protein